MDLRPNHTAQPAVSDSNPFKVEIVNGPGGDQVTAELIQAAGETSNINS